MCYIWHMCIVHYKTSLAAVFLLLPLPSKPSPHICHVNMVSTWSVQGNINILVQSTALLAWHNKTKPSKWNKAILVEVHFRRYNCLHWVFCHHSFFFFYASSTNIASGVWSLELRYGPRTQVTIWNSDYQIFGERVAIALSIELLGRGHVTVVYMSCYCSGSERAGLELDLCQM